MVVRPSRISTGYAPASSHSRRDAEEPSGRNTPRGHSRNTSSVVVSSSDEMTESVTISEDEVTIVNSRTSLRSDDQVRGRRGKPRPVAAQRSLQAEFPQHKSHSPELLSGSEYSSDEAAMQQALIDSCQSLPAKLSTIPKRIRARSVDRKRNIFSGGKTPLPCENASQTKDKIQNKNNINC